MLVSAANCLEGEPRGWINAWIGQAMEAGSDLLLCPARYSELYGEGFLQDMKAISSKYRELLFCPGTYPEKTEAGTYISASFFYRGDIVMTQRQLYLSRAEREKGILRGSEIQTVTFQRTHIGLLLPTDAWYPQVSRAFALGGVKLLLAPSAFQEDRPSAIEHTLWSVAQENSLYVLTSALEGDVDGTRYAGESMLFAPLELSQGRRKNGVLARREAGEPLTSLPIEVQRLEAARAERNPLATLNGSLYKRELFKEEIT